VCRRRAQALGSIDEGRRRGLFLIEYFKFIRAQPEALGATQTVLAQELIAGGPDAERDALLPRVAALLGALATGFARQMRLCPLPPPITVTFRPRVDTTNYRLLIEHIPASTYIAAFDEASSTVYTSPQIAPILGFSQAEWMADHTRWLTQIHPDDRARVLAELARIHAGGLPRPCEYRMLTRDGRVIWFLDDAAIMRDAHNQPLYLYGVMSDITERKRIEAELADARRRLAEGQDAERSRLARELHDDAVQQLLYIARLIDQRQRALAEGWTSESEVVTHAVGLEAIRGEVLAVARQLRTVIGELRPAGLDDLGLAIALEGYVACVMREGGPDLPQLALDLDQSGVELPKLIRLCLFRVAQEALRNAIRHAQAQQVTLRLRLSPAEALLIVQDDGCGFCVPVDLRVHKCIISPGRGDGLRRCSRALERGGGSRPAAEAAGSAYQARLRGLIMGKLFFYDPLVSCRTDPIARMVIGHLHHAQTRGLPIRPHRSWM